MIVIENIGIYIPDNFESNFDKKDLFEVDEDFINKIGVQKVSRRKEGEETSDLCVNAFDNLRNILSNGFEEVDCIIVCTQNPDGGGIPHTSAIVHAKLGFPDDCACFDISLGCSGYVYGLSIVKSFMESNGLKSGLFFTADPYSKVVDPSDKNTALLFGDCATVTYLRDIPAGHDRFVFKAFAFNTEGKKWDALHNQGGKLEMNGRAIFKLAIVQAPKQINNLLESANFSLSDVDLFLLHQGSKYIVDNLKRAMKLPDHKVPLKLQDQGNTVSSSIPLLLKDYLSSTDLKSIVLSGFGVGLSWASCLLVK